MSSSEPDGIRRNRECHRAASARPKMMTCFGNFGVEKSSRKARRYATPATARGMMNDGSPVRLKLREQIASATSKMTPSPYSLCEDVSFTALPNPDAGARLLVPTRRTRPRFAAPSPERAAVPEPTESHRFILLRHDLHCIA